MAEIRLQNLAHSYTSTPAGPEDYAIREMNHIWEQAAPMHCSGLRAAASPRCSTSFPDC